MTSSGVETEVQHDKGSYKFLAGIALVGAALLVVLLFEHRGLYQTFRLRHERQRLEQENARLAEENIRLARTVDRLQHDPEMIQDLVRRELNFVKKNEVIFQLSPDSGGKSPGPAPVPQAGAPPTVPSPAAAQNQVAKKSGAWDWLWGRLKMSAAPKAE